MINLFDAFLAPFQTKAWEFLVKALFLGTALFTTVPSMTLCVILSPESPKAGDDSLSDDQTQGADVLEDSAGVWMEAKEPSYLLGNQTNSKVRLK